MSSAQQASYVAAAANYSAAAARAYGAAASQPAAGYATIAGLVFVLYCLVLTLLYFIQSIFYSYFPTWLFYFLILTACFLLWAAMVENTQTRTWVMELVLWQVMGWVLHLLPYTIKLQLQFTWLIHFFFVWFYRRQSIGVVIIDLHPTEELMWNCLSPIRIDSNLVTRHLKYLVTSKVVTIAMIDLVCSFCFGS